MFWGCTIKKGNDHKFEAEDQAILHVSNAALGLGAKGSAAVFAKVDGKEFVITHLTAGKTEHSTLDLYFRNDQEVTFGVKGEAEVHLSGYFEPDHGDDEDMYGEDFPYGEEDDEEEDDEELEDEDDSEEEAKPVAKKPLAIADVKKTPEAPKKTPEVVKKTETAAAPKAAAEAKKQPSLQETLALKKAAEKVAAAQKAAAAAFEDDEDDEDDDDLDIEDEDEDDDEDLDDEDDDEEDDGEDIDDDVSDSENEALDQLLKKSKGNNAQAVAKPAQAQAKKTQ